MTRENLHSIIHSLGLCIGSTAQSDPSKFTTSDVDMSVIKTDFNEEQIREAFKINEVDEVRTT